MANVNTKAHVLVRDRFTCRFCGVPLFLAQAIKLLDWHAPDLGLWDAHGKVEPLRSRWATVDHLVPEAEGGMDVLDNLLACCVTCNSRKGKGKHSAVLTHPAFQAWDGLAPLFLALSQAHEARLSTEDKKWRAALRREGVRDCTNELKAVLAWLRMAKTGGIGVLDRPPY